jgi:hypothetical protein
MTTAIESFEDDLEQAVGVLGLAGQVRADIRIGKDHLGRPAVLATKWPAMRRLLLECLDAGQQQRANEWMQRVGLQISNHVVFAPGGGM